MKPIDFGLSETNPRVGGESVAARAHILIAVISGFPD